MKYTCKISFFQTSQPSTRTDEALWREDETYYKQDSSPVADRDLTLGNNSQPSIFHVDRGSDPLSFCSSHQPCLPPQVSGRILRRMTSLPSSSQSPGCGTVSPSRISLRTSQGSTYNSPILSEPKPLAAVFPGTSMPPSCPLPLSPADGIQAPDRGGGARLGSTLSLVEGRGLMGSPLRSGMTAVPQHFGTTLPRQTQPLAYGADPYGLYQKSALPRPDSLIGQSHDLV